MTREHPHVAVVGGAGAGIGRAVCEELLDNGHVVVGVDLLDDGSGRHPERYATVVGDARQAETWRRAGEVAETLGGSPVTAVLPAVGGAVFASVLSADDEDWAGALELNLMTSVRAAQVFVPGLISRGCGTFVTIGSTSAHVVSPEAPLYSVAKAALVQFTRALALEVAGTGVCVSCVSPGATDTPGLRNNLPKKGQTLQDFRRGAAAQPLGRFLNPGEIAEVVCSVITASGQALNGSVITADGGASIAPPGASASRHHEAQTGRSRDR